MIGVFIIGELAGHPGQGSEIRRRILRAGVTAAVRISPLIALGSVAWVVLVRRFGRVALAITVDESTPMADPASAQTGEADPAVSPGHGPHPPDG